MFFYNFKYRSVINPYFRDRGIAKLLIIEAEDSNAAVDKLTQLWEIPRDEILDEWHMLTYERASEPQIAGENVYELYMHGDLIPRTVFVHYANGGFEDPTVWDYFSHISNSTPRQRADRAVVAFTISEFVINNYGPYCRPTYGGLRSLSGRSAIPQHDKLTAAMVAEYVRTRDY